MGIFTLKDKYILGYITAIWVYLCFRANHTSFSYANYDNILLSIIIFGGWYIICSYRTFVMTRGKLCKHYMETAQNIMVIAHLGKIYDICDVSG